MEEIQASFVRRRVWGVLFSILIVGFWNPGSGFGQNLPTTIRVTAESVALFQKNIAMFSALSSGQVSFGSRASAVLRRYAQFRSMMEDPELSNISLALRNFAVLERLPPAAREKAMRDILRIALFSDNKLVSSLLWQELPLEFQAVLWRDLNSVMPFEANGIQFGMVGVPWGVREVLEGAYGKEDWLSQKTDIFRVYSALKKIARKQRTEFRDSDGFYRLGLLYPDFADLKVKRLKDLDRKEILVLKNAISNLAVKFTDVLEYERFPSVESFYEAIQNMDGSRPTRIRKIAMFSEWYARQLSFHTRTNAVGKRLPNEKVIRHFPSAKILRHIETKVVPYLESELNGYAEALSPEMEKEIVNIRSRSKPDLLAALGDELSPLDYFSPRFLMAIQVARENLQTIKEILPVLRRTQKELRFRVFPELRNINPKKPESLDREEAA